jgi:hypothetical protein
VFLLAGTKPRATLLCKTRLIAVINIDTFANYFFLNKVCSQIFLPTADKSNLYAEKKQVDTEIKKIICQLYLYSNRIDLRIKATRGLIPLPINKTEQLKLEYSVICKPFLFEDKSVKYPEYSFRIID